MRLRIFDKVNKRFEEDPAILCRRAGFHVLWEFHDIGVQGDGTPVVFARGGGFDYLDSNLYSVVIEIGDE